jgi:outer membrane protein assembly factor BamB
MYRDMTMNCQDTRDRVELFVLGDLDGRERAEVGQHLADCPACRSAADAVQRTVEQLRAGRDGTKSNRAKTNSAERQANAGTARPTPQFTRRLADAIEAELSRTTRTLRRPLLAYAAAIAAVILLGLILRPAWQAASRSTTTVPPVVQAAPPAPAPPLVEVWQLPGALPTPAAADEAVVVRGQDLYLLMDDKGTARAAALDCSDFSPSPVGGGSGRGDIRSSHRVRWMSQVECSGNLAVDGDRVYCLAPGQGGRTDLVALRNSDGTLLWRLGQDRPGPLLQPCRPVVLPGNAAETAGRVCWTTQSSVLMLRGSDGQVLWRTPLSNVGSISAARMLGDRLYVATSKALVGLSPATGEQVERIDWPVRAAGELRPLLDIAGDRLIAAIPLRSGGSQVICMAPETPSPPPFLAPDGGARLAAVWSVAMPQTFHLLATADRLYVRTQDVHALDLATGRTIWRRPAQGCSPVTADDGMVFFLDTSKDRERLLAVDGRTGELAWQFAGLKSCDAFIKTGRTGYVKTQDGVLRALSLARL